MPPHFHQSTLMGTTITNDLRWKANTSSTLVKAQKRLFFLHQLKKFGMTPQVLTRFYFATTESILCFSILVWYADSSASDRLKPQRVIRSAERIIWKPLPPLDLLYNPRLCTRALKVSTEFDPETNSTSISTNVVKEFIIFGFPSLQDLNILLFCVFLFIYLFTVTGNGTIFLLTTLDQKLHTPMYFFVRNLSFLDMSSTTVTIPRMLSKFSMHNDVISYMGCFLQMYFFIGCNSVECLLLTVMAYDRYAAICFPLHYHNIMGRHLHVFLGMMSWILGFVFPIAMITLAIRLPFCGKNVIHHYYCDHPPLLQLACADTSLNVAVGSSLSAIVLLICFSLIVMSYIKIINSIFKISSSNGRRKTFSTCASHFVVVNMYFLPLFFMYVRPKPSYSADIDSLVAMFYAALTPMLNPVVYSLRNKDIKNSFRKQIMCTYNVD
ncbi:olfactory receptor 6N1-like [Hyperolius riggenbachi]|uniref:olfactory receptor 6N1-like n=1 Tax=Hyperolius riggenbachi TaxID=752182 RepID=UPI0035A2C8F0